jgi:hypothetical protein
MFLRLINSRKSEFYLGKRAVAKKAYLKAVCKALVDFELFREIMAILAIIKEF